MINKQPLIAVVDDDAPVRTSLRRLLRSSGFSVTTYESGDAFLEALPAAGSGAEPDCLILDLHMPGLNGLEVRAALTTAKRDIPTLVITGKEEPDTGGMVRAAGAAAFLTKPFDESALLTAVRSTLTHPCGTNPASFHGAKCGEESFPLPGAPAANPQISGPQKPFASP